LFMVFQALLGVYFTNLFPAMSAATREPPEALIRLIRRAIHSVFWITAAGSVCMSFLAPLVIGLVYGERYATGDAVTTLVLLSWILPILVWRRTGRNSLIVLHHVRAELVCSVIGLTLLVVAVYPLTRLFGLAGAAAAMVFSEAVAALLTWTVLIVRLLERRRWDASSGGLREISSG
ncbi:MAG TPA: polysaccharide biosynthesis C-terminal domain-containing protein, partial [Longimicrobiales bacterium]|nr:polysaccharide biosynthesis C-terminal domain-containing protein [Longimicrobiales bacterium]